MNLFRRWHQLKTKMPFIKMAVFDRCFWRDALYNPWDSRAAILMDCLLETVFLCYKTLESFQVTLMEFLVVGLFISPTVRPLSFMSTNFLWP